MTACPLFTGAIMAVIQIKSTHPETQGDFVLNEETDFDAARGHELFEPAAEAEPKKPRAKPVAQAEQKD
jgi:hypothetical protein